jgi:hypothetical protein
MGRSTAPGPVQGRATLAKWECRAPQALPRASTAQLPPLRCPGLPHAAASRCNSVAAGLYTGFSTTNPSAGIICVDPAGQPSPPFALAYSKVGSRRLSWSGGARMPSTLLTRPHGTLMRT